MKLTTYLASMGLKTGVKTMKNHFVRILQKTAPFLRPQPLKPCPAAAASPPNHPTSIPCRQRHQPSPAIMRRRPIHAPEPLKMVRWRCTSQCTSADLCTREVLGNTMWSLVLQLHKINNNQLVSDSNGGGRDNTTINRCKERERHNTTINMFT